MERFDPEGCKNPEGEWKLEKQFFEPAAKAATGQKRRTNPHRGEPVRVAEQKGRTGSGSGWQECEVAGREL